MSNKYGGSEKSISNQNLESLVNVPVRQILPQRVLDSVANAAPVSVSAYNTAATIAGPLTNGAGPVVAAWNAEVTDSDALHDNAVNNSRLTIPAGKPGQYKFQTRIQFIAAGEGGVTGHVKIRKNGATVQKTVSTALNTGSTTTIMLDYQDFYSVADYVEIVVDATGGTGIGTTLNMGAEVSYFIGAKQLV